MAAAKKLPAHPFGTKTYIKSTSIKAFKPAKPPKSPKVPKAPKFPAFKTIHMPAAKALKAAPSVPNTVLQTAIHVSAAKTTAARVHPTAITLKPLPAYKPTKPVKSPAPASTSLRPPTIPTSMPMKGGLLQ